MAQTRDQRRASAILAAFDEARIGQQGADVKNAFGARCNKFAIMVRTNGLAQTLSFFDAKAQGRGAQATAYALYQQCLEQAMVELGQWTRQNDNERLWRKLVHATLDMGAHMSMTRESLALAGWMKRFAVSVAGCDPDAATE